MTFDEFRTNLFAQHAAGELAEALAFLEANSAEFAANTQRIAYWRACLATALDQPEKALTVLEEAVEEGYWFAPSMLQRDGDLGPLRESARFQQIVAASEARMMVALAESHPTRIVFEPNPLPDGPLPLLIALHGNNGNAKDEASQWDSLAEEGWLVVLPQSSQLVGPDRYVWDDVPLADQEIVHHFAEISAEYSIDPKRIVLGGFSRGGLRAIQLALKGDIPATGYVGVVPSLVEDIPAPSQDAVQRNLRAALLFGERDPNLASAQTLEQTLPLQGVATQLSVYSGGHQYPNDMAEQLASAMTFVAA